ncbi:hypothetical protein BaRGS_00025672 [Batillaria attramentaria]|uniref:Uncharacterized protein n=1 Tax=Batillaria attramentaria TaxID=370345 RepID=A0ABD0K7F2_9CAEN
MVIAQETNSTLPSVPAGFNASCTNPADDANERFPDSSYLPLPLATSLCHVAGRINGAQGASNEQSVIL